MNKYDNVIYKVLKYSLVVFGIISLILFLLVMFIDNIPKFIGYIYVFMILIVFLLLIYSVIMGFIYYKKESSIKDILIESIKSGLYALVLIVVYNLIFNKKVVISYDFIIIVIFIFIPFINKYFEFHRKKTRN